MPYSRVNTPHSEDFVHRRTQSLDSVSSGHSSGSASFNDRDRDSPRKKISVRPYEDPQEEEELPTYKRFSIIVFLVHPLNLRNITVF